ncbi:MAG: radical SAM protein [Clostridia bacterium]|nr:radical SAM protein [Clostridia bacterium]
MKHANIPIFVPHMGCPHTCVFCNQRTISGKTAFSLEEAKRTIDESLLTLGDRQAEIAFFGGSFTAIDRRLMTDLLRLGKEQIDKGRVVGIRLSTRPDCIDGEILDILEEYGVTAIELGCQSSDDGVLSACGRGHTKKDIERAFSLIKERGIFEAVGQMMPGLPCSNFGKELQTAEDLVSFGADAVRIYPTLVLEGTALAKLYKDGLYTPLSLEEGVERCARLVEYFEGQGVRILKVGLHAEEGFASKALAGCYHPALGELVENRLYFQKISDYFEKNPPKRGKTYRVFVAKGRLSKAVGQKKCNKTKLTEQYGFDLVFSEESNLSRRQIRVQEEGAEKCD